MDQVLHADDAELAQGALNEVVGGDWGAVAVDLGGESFGFLSKITDLCNKNSGFSLYQTVSGHYTNDGVGNVGYRKIHSRTAYSPAAQNE